MALVAAFRLKLALVALRVARCHSVLVLVGLATVVLLV
jgi:hypothetical protein